MSEDTCEDDEDDEERPKLIVSNGLQQYQKKWSRKYCSTHLCQGLWRVSLAAGGRVWEGREVCPTVRQPEVPTGVGKIAQTPKK